MIAREVKRVLDAGVDSYNAPKYWSISGVKVGFKPAPSGVGAKEWRKVLEEWLPRFDDAGLLDGLHKIAIAENAAPGDAAGIYYNDGSIRLDNDPMSCTNAALIAADDKAEVLVHELMHHAHLTVKGHDGGDVKHSLEGYFSEYVSYYSKKSVNEAIAEMGVSIIQGNRHPAKLRAFYEQHGGPMEVYDLG